MGARESSCPHGPDRREPMELSQLRTFRVVAETLNFTRAAERLNLTQSAVSHQIKSLEMELGEPIFIRAKRGVKLSQVGQAVLEHAIRRTVESQEFIRASEKYAVRPAFMPATEFGELIAREDADLARVMQLIGLKK